MSTVSLPPEDKITTEQLEERSEHRVERSDTAGRLIAAAILIGLGAFLLLANFVPIGGGALFLGLGLAFAVARVAAGRYGLAVPAGILLGFGAFVALEEARLLPANEGGWFFILLAAGFLAVYIIGMRPEAFWPLIPAAALAVFGILLIGVINLTWLAFLSWTINYWPIVLIVVGVWLLFRDRLPADLRRPFSAILTILLVLYGVVAIGAAVAAGASGIVVAPPFGAGAPFTQTYNLNAPLDQGDTLQVVNSNGRTTVRAIDGSNVQVTATAYSWITDQDPDVRLTPSGQGLSLEASNRGPIGTRVNYEIGLPAGTNVDIQSTSGDVSIQDTGGSVRITGTSGDIAVERVSGAVNVSATSGDIRIADVGGDVSATATSGSIDATNVDRLRTATTSSGRIMIDGRFTGDARVEASSGDITLRFAPNSSVNIEAITSSGRLTVRDLTLSNQQVDARRVTGTLGAGDGRLTVRTSSGDILLATQ